MVGQATWRTAIDGPDIAGPVTFWGEWEASSAVDVVWPGEGDLPRALHRPAFDLEPPAGRRENTDPWVFGEQFRYSNCRQLYRGRPSGLQSLPRGSVILFGSRLSGRFVLDTVFVVADGFAATVDDHLDVDPDPLFRRNVWGSLTTDTTNGEGWLRSQEFTLYRGATPQNPVGGMYSFVPARPGGQDRFARPAITSPGGLRRPVVNPRNSRAPSGFRSADRIPLGQAAMVWADVAATVARQGLVLAHHLDDPDGSSR